MVVAGAAVAVVSDDNLSLALIHLNLARRGYAVVVALLDHVEQGWQPPWPPALLVLDLVAPDPYCWELAERVRRRHWARTPRLLLLTVCTPDAHRRISLAAHHHIRKPFTIAELVEAVEQAIAEPP
jgi:DNA-binding response OmpR family regulator